MTLSDQQRLFASLLPRLIDQAIVLGFEVTLGEAWRTPEQAKWNVEHGSGIADSLHNSRLAIDLNLFRDGVFLRKSEDYLPLGVWWTQQHSLARWGGNFARRPDGNHFSLMYKGIE